MQEAQRGEGEAGGGQAALRGGDEGRRGEDRPAAVPSPPQRRHRAQRTLRQEIPRRRRDTPLPSCMHKFGVILQ